MPDITIGDLQNIQPDQVLSGFAMDTPARGLVADRLFKRATPGAHTIKLYDWGKQGLKPLAGTLVTDQTTKIASFGIDAPSKQVIEVEPHAMRVPLNAFTLDKAQEVENGMINLLQKKISTVTSQWLTTKDSFAAALMASAAVFAGGFGNITSASNKWSASGGLPVDDVMAAKEVVALRTGFVPNKMQISFSLANALRKNAQISGLNPSTQKGIATMEQVTAYLELDEIIVATSIKNSAKKGKPNSLAWMWPSAEAILYYEAPVLNEETRTFALNIPWQRWLGIQGWIEQESRLITSYNQVECMRYVVVDNLCAQKINTLL